jgi:hypothetical protein
MHEPNPNSLIAIRRAFTRRFVARFGDGIFFFAITFRYASSIRRFFASRNLSQHTLKFDKKSSFVQNVGKMESFVALLCHDIGICHEVVLEYDVSRRYDPVVFNNFCAALSARLLYQKNLQNWTAVDGRTCFINAVYDAEGDDESFLLIFGFDHEAYRTSRYADIYDAFMYKNDVVMMANALRRLGKKSPVLQFYYPIAMKYIL